MAILTALSVACNILLIWYISRLIKFVDFTTLDMEAVKMDLQKYEEHLERVYGLELFYGDETLKGLLDHTKDIKEDISGFVNGTGNILGTEILISEEQND